MRFVGLIITAIAVIVLDFIIWNKCDYSISEIFVASLLEYMAYVGGYLQCWCTIKEDEND